MEQRKMMALGSTSEPWESNHLNENDCWMYQLALERALKSYCPDPKMHGRFVTMVALLANQARRAVPHGEE